MFSESKSGNVLELSCNTVLLHVCSKARFLETIFDSLLCFENRDGKLRAGRCHTGCIACNRVLHPRCKRSRAHRRDLGPVRCRACDCNFPVRDEQEFKASWRDDAWRFFDRGSSATSAGSSPLRSCSISPRTARQSASPAPREANLSGLQLLHEAVAADAAPQWWKECRGGTCSRRDS